MSQLYRMENIPRAKLAYIGMMVISCLICGYMLLLAVLDYRGLKTAQNSLERFRLRSDELAQKARLLERQSVQSTPIGDAGFEVFAVWLTRYGTARKIEIESVTPQGPGNTVEAKVDDLSLGEWRADRIRVRGQGQFEQVMGLLDEIREPDIPVQLEAFSLQATGDGYMGMVAFELTLVVYGKSVKAS